MRAVFAVQHEGMAKVCKGYPSDVTEEERGFVAYRLLRRENAGQREHDLRDVFNAVRYVARSGVRGV